VTLWANRMGAAPADALMVFTASLALTNGWPPAT